MQAANVVSLKEFGNRLIEMVVVAVENGRLFVCRPEEFEAAKVEKREPACIGMAQCARKLVRFLPHVEADLGN